MARAEEQRLTVVGLNRFGLGARPGDLSRIGSNIREALLQEVVSETTAVSARENLLSSAEAFRRLKAERDEVKSLQDKNPASADAKKASPDPQATKEDVKNPPRRVVREIFQAETIARLEAAKQAPTGFAERLVLFWLG